MNYRISANARSVFPIYGWVILAFFFAFSLRVDDDNMAMLNDEQGVENKANLAAPRNEVDGEMLRNVIARTP